MTQVVIGRDADVLAALEAAETAIDDASSVVDPGDDEGRAYERPLAQVRAAIAHLRATQGAVKRTYPKDVVECVLEFDEDNPGRVYPKPLRGPGDVAFLPPRVVAKAWMEWKGIIGYSERVWQILDAPIV